ncbi:hypothetical protein CK203_049554 [Vitis vinifera]|uniref:Uncharacterized protein n=1 Tax=Vitis vinifera TaxID=29760 RepID=A0A438HB88_VITVI|nr:hypothetical protein CK203_049554 [Vitis vinifera]
MEEGVRNIPGDERDCRRRRSLRLVAAEDLTKRMPYRKKRERRDQSAPQSCLTGKAYAFQKVVSRSNAESEYKGLANVAVEIT